MHLPEITGNLLRVCGLQPPGFEFGQWLNIGSEYAANIKVKEVHPMVRRKTMIETLVNTCLVKCVTDIFRGKAVVEASATPRVHYRKILIISSAHYVDQSQLWTTMLSMPLASSPIASLKSPTTRISSSPRARHWDRKAFRSIRNADLGEL
jgi:hypothetical protein